MTSFTDWTPQGVIPAVLLPFTAISATRREPTASNHRDLPLVQAFTAAQSTCHRCEVLALLGRLPPAVVRPPLVKLPAGEICRLKQAIAEAGLQLEPASARAAE